VPLETEVIYHRVQGSISYSLHTISGAFAQIWQAVTQNSLQVSFLFSHFSTLNIPYAFDT
jgi:hypothetical protein